MRFLFSHHFNTILTNTQTINTQTHTQTNTQQSSFDNIDERSLFNYLIKLFNLCIHSQFNYILVIPVFNFV